MNTSPNEEILSQVPAPAVLLLAPLATSPRAFDRGRPLDVTTTSIAWISCAVQTGVEFNRKGTADPIRKTETDGCRVGDSLLFL